MAQNPFDMPQMFQMPKMPQLPELYESLLGTPAAADLGITNTSGDYYRNSKFWNEGMQVNNGQSYDDSKPPTQIKDPTKDITNDFSGTYFL